MNRSTKIDRILGIDPGFGRMGYGVIEKKNGVWVHVAHGLVETSAKDSFPKRLQKLAESVRQIIRTHKPTQAALEELFFYKNVTTAINVGQARGVILLTCVEAGLPVDECTPLQVKQALTGYGRAEKRQIQSMVRLQLGLKEKSIQDDAADALAIALTIGVAQKFS